jgi:hypothetical protein
LLKVVVAVVMEVVDPKTVKTAEERSSLVVTLLWNHAQEAAAQPLIVMETLSTSQEEPLFSVRINGLSNV